MKSVVLSSVLFMVLSVASPPVLAQSAGQEVLSRFLTDDVEAVARLDVKRLTTEKFAETLGSMGVVPPSEIEAVLQRLQFVEMFKSRLVDAGVEGVYVLARMTDVQYGGPTVVLRMKDEESADQFGTMLNQLLKSESNTPETALVQPSNFNLRHIRSMGRFVVATPAVEQMEQATETLPTARDVKVAAATAFDSALGVLVLGSGNSRKVMAQIGGQLPTPFQDLDASFLAEEVDWMAIRADVGKKPVLEMVLLAPRKSRQVAEMLKNGIGKLPDAGFMKASGQATLFRRILKAVDVQEKDGLVTVSLNNLFKDQNLFRETLGSQIAKMRQQARETQTMNNLRQCVIAMHNFADANRKLPMRCTFDDDGKPLLSWRVHMLPFMGELELYRKFKLEEPWDSEHNRKLIPLMPRIYADVMPGGADNNKAGKTIYQVPVGDGTLFGTEEPIWFSDVHDGTSNTIAIAAVAQRNAVTWTKPADWEVGENRGREALLNGEETMIPVALADGSAQRLPATVQQEYLYKLLTIAGGEIASWPKK